MAEQPGIMKFLSNPLIAVLGIAAAKWLGSHRKWSRHNTNKGDHTRIALYFAKPLSSRVGLATTNAFNCLRVVLRLKTAEPATIAFAPASITCQVLFPSDRHPLQSKGQDRAPHTSSAACRFWDYSGDKALTTKTGLTLIISTKSQSSSTYLGLTAWDWVQHPLSPVLWFDRVGVQVRRYAPHGQWYGLHPLAKSSTYLSGSTIKWTSIGFW